MEGAKISTGKIHGDEDSEMEADSFESYGRTPVRSRKVTRILMKEEKRPGLSFNHEESTSPSTSFKV